MMSSRQISQKRSEEIKKATLPFLFGLIFLILSVGLFAIGANQECKSSGCGDVIRGVVIQVITTPIMAFSLALTVTGAIYFFVNLRSTKKIETHPILWSLALFIPVCFIIVQMERAILGT